MEKERRRAPSELHPTPPRRGWGLLIGGLVVGALFAAVLSLLIADHVSEDRRFDRLHASVVVTRHNSSDETAALVALRQAVAALRSQVAGDSGTWSQDTAELKAAQAALVTTQADVSQQSNRIGALHACLGGVQQALNALAINNQASAVSSLDAVASSCADASGN